MPRLVSLLLTIGAAVCGATTVISGQSFINDTYTVTDPETLVVYCSFTGSQAALIVNASTLSGSGATVNVTVSRSTFASQAYVSLVGTASGSFTFTLRGDDFVNAYIVATNLTLNGCDVVYTIADSTVTSTEAYQGNFVVPNVGWDNVGYFLYLDGLLLTSQARFAVDDTNATINISASTSFISGSTRRGLFA